MSLFGTVHAAIQFPLYEYLKETQKTKNGEPNILLASVVSKIIASSITYPHEPIRTRFQAQKLGVQNKGIFQAISDMYKKEGVILFYRGMGTNMIRTVPTSAITLIVYERALKFIISVDS
eukprot:TRINITY_DN3618_c0_g1_i2.p2 TRINITY_DN3618_c0_g1~~TRINITY_DN3618_c0_g1_i2.p2  ORF type:complete len:120 (-),score=20.99 TRINITY_DN3618_c0_g1_i2:45-404(-)